MKLLLVVAAAVFVSAASAAKKPDVEVLDLKVSRDGSTVTIDGHIRATGEKPLPKLVLTIDFIASGSTPLASKQVAIDEPRLVPGDEAAFHAVTEAPPRAIECSVRAFKSGGEVEVSVAKPGPYTITD